MQRGRLTPLQWQILQLLSHLKPPFTLTGGAALSGVHLHHRTTRDLDLFWRDRSDLHGVGDQARSLLQRAGLDVAPLQESPGFGRLRVADQTETCIVDLIAEPSAALHDPEEFVLPDQSVILVDTRRAILANKLCTLLSRAELRDLVDVQALLEAGGDLGQGLQDAAQIDGGFSPLTLAWVLRPLKIEPLGSALGWTEERSAKLQQFHGELIRRLTELTAPD